MRRLVLIGLIWEVFDRNEELRHAEGAALELQSLWGGKVGVEKLIGYGGTLESHELQKSLPGEGPGEGLE